MRFSIRRRVLRLLILGVVGTFLAVGATTFYGALTVRDSMSRQGDTFGDFLAHSMGNFAEYAAKRRLQEVTEVRAQHIDRELHIIGEDVEYMADAMTRILCSPDLFLPRFLPDVRHEVNIPFGTPYIHYSPRLLSTDMNEALRSEVGLAGNFADVLVFMSKSYGGYSTSFYAGSKNGYVLGLDISTEQGGAYGIFKSKEAREEFLSSYDPRDRFWYQLGLSAERPVFSTLHKNTEGLPDVSCVMPYYDRNGVAGVVGIGHSTEDIYKFVADSAIGETGVSFVLDREGHVVFSSQSQDILAANLDAPSLLGAKTPDVAEAARCMTAGGSGVVSVRPDENAEDILYLAFAPMKSTGWSFGSVMEADEVLAPVKQTEGEVRKRMSVFGAALRQIFSDTAAKAGLAMIPVLLLVLYGGGLMAGRVTRPIRTLASGAKEIAAGNFDMKLNLATGDETEYLADCFNKMADDLKKYTDNLAAAAAKEEHVRTELAVAARIQEDMLPRVFPRRKEFGLYAMMEAAKDIGGDFYDFYMPDADHLVVTIADVSGKGIPAALFMAKAQSILKNSVLAAGASGDLAHVLSRANRELCASNEAAMFVTVFTGILDLRSGRFDYADGGHCPPLWRHGGRYDFLPMQKGCILGLTEFPYKRQSITLSQGDTLFLYTDGVSEAMNEAGKLLMEPRVRDLLNAVPQAVPVEELLRGMMESIRRHTGQAEQSDDITMLGLQYFGK
ncbi:MAG: SpoIIE family protein phosphatase [Fretibacterium sp.]|nr:SpoIIE family protein phosphatase [Fretibacterium sp.]